MVADILNGKKRAQEILDILSDNSSHNRTMKLASIVVGNDKQSQYFSDLKLKKAHEIGLSGIKKSFPESFDPRKVVTYIHELNDDRNIIGIVPQLPLPPQFDRASVLKTIHPFKDIDCLHPKNLGLLLEGSYTFISPVVLAIMEQIVLSKKYESKTIPYLSTSIELPDLTGIPICIVGTGLLVGKPLTAFLLNQGATITVIDEHTPNPFEHTQKADIVVTGTNASDVLTADAITDGTVVIDVGNDINAELFLSKEIFLSTNPGGVGPLTVSYLLFNAIHSIIAS